MINFDLLSLTTSSVGAAMNWQGLSVLLHNNAESRIVPFLHMEIVSGSDRSRRAFSQRKVSPFPEGIKLPHEMSADDLAIMLFDFSFMEARHPECDQFGKPGTWKGWEALKVQFNGCPIIVVQAVWILAR